ncbi:MAG: methyltransferase domain-containing protein, partial [Chloroflexota bacterium]
PPPDAAFDALAPTYDDDFTETIIGHHLRERVHRRLDILFSAGDALLELGCGTGEDALYLAQRGVHITVTDASSSMLTVAREKLALTGTRVVMLDIGHLPGHPGDPRVFPARSGKPGFSGDQPDDLTGPAGKFTQIQGDSGALSGEPGLLPGRPSRKDDFPDAPGDAFGLSGPFDGVLANFGVLNVVSNYISIARWLAARVRPSGTLAFAVMAPNCLWELAWHALNGDFTTATRRWHTSTTFHETPGQPIEIYYPSPSQLARQFAPYFERTALVPLGLWLPPSDVYPMIERRPKLLKWLTYADDNFGANAITARFADHYWIELQRTDAPAP